MHTHAYHVLRVWVGSAELEITPPDVIITSFFDCWQPHPPTKKKTTQQQSHVSQYYITVLSVQSIYRLRLMCLCTTQLFDTCWLFGRAGIFFSVKECACNSCFTVLVLYIYFSSFGWYNVSKQITWISEVKVSKLIRRGPGKRYWNKKYSCHINKQ